MKRAKQWRPYTVDRYLTHPSTRAAMGRIMHRVMWQTVRGIVQRRQREGLL